MSEEPKLSLVLGAAAAATPVDQAKEPPQRGGKPVLAFSAAAQPAPLRTREFVYDWEERLKAVNPLTHPMMQFTDYQLYKDRLFDALDILNATPDVDNAISCDHVMAAYKRLRQACNNQNELNRMDNRGCSKFEMAAYDMQALMEMATHMKKDSAVRAFLEMKWLVSMESRDNERDGEQLRKELVRGLNASIPGSGEEALYEAAIKQFAEKDLRARHVVPQLRLIQTPELALVK